MKTYLTILAMVLAFNLSSAQTLTFEQLKESEKKPKGSFTEYITSRGDTIRVGDKIKLGNPSNLNNQFVYIYEGSVLAMSFASITSQGWESEVLKIRVGGTKRMGFKASITSKTETGAMRFYFNYEDALSVGEITSNAMTRTEAIAKLKESKELLDLEMMTQEEYDKLKNELAPIIKGKN